MKTRKRLLIPISFLTLFALLGGCARTNDDGPGGGTDGTPTPTPTPTTGIEYPSPTPTPTPTLVPQGVFDACLTQCQNDCTATITNPTYLAECKAACVSTPVEEGGCAAANLNPPGGDPFVKPEGSTSVLGTLRHCTETEDALSVSNGLMSFVTQRGTRQITRSLLTFFHPFAAVGNAMSLWLGNTDRALYIRAEVKIGTHTFNWPYPGVLSFPLAKKVGEEVDPKIDLTQPTKLWVSSVEAGKARSSFYSHWANYWGQGVDQEVVTYRRRPWEPVFWFIGNGGSKSCEFKTNFEFVYFQKPE